MTRTFLISAAAAVLLLGGCQSSTEQREITTLPEIKEAPAFRFTNYDGSTISEEAVKGKVFIAYFFFTSCGGPCPVMNSNATVLQAEYEDEEDFRIVGFSVDPERDDVERLARYAERYSAKAGRWYMLRNEKDIVAELASKGFMMGDADTPAMHSSRFALIDRSGTIRGYYDGTDQQRVDELRAAIDFLLREGA